MNEKFRIKLTTEQQKQVFEATGKTFTELTFDHAQSGKLTERELGAVAGGTQADKDYGLDLEGGHTTYKPF
jgi:hypothetical protein